MAAEGPPADREDHGYEFDLIVIGAGSAGVRTARKVASWGGKVAVVELPLHPDKHNSTIQLGGVGGGCVLRGCVPKKLLQRASDMVQLFEDSAAFGWEIDPEHLPKHNWSKLIDAQREAVHTLSQKWEAKLSKVGVQILWGWGSVKGPHSVNVASEGGSNKQYTAKNIVVAAGSRPASLPIPGAELCINYNEALALPACPKKVALIGAASSIGMALLGILAGFRCEVHVVCDDELPLGPGIDREMATFALEQYRARGHIMHMGYETVEVLDEAQTNWHKEEQQKQRDARHQASGHEEEQGAEDASGDAVTSPLSPDRMAAVTNGVPVNTKGRGDRDEAPDVYAARDQGAHAPAGPVDDDEVKQEQEMRPKTPPPEEEPLGHPGVSGDSGGDTGDSDEQDLVTSTGVTALPEAYASDDPKVTSVSTTRDTHKVLQKGLRSLAIRRVDGSTGNAANGTASSNGTSEDNNGSDSQGKGTGGSDGREWLHGFDYVIMDVGRVPHTQDLGLEEVGVRMGEQGRVMVDDYLHTNIPSIWAAGEVSGRMMLQTAARMEGHALARTLWLGQPTPANYWALPMPIWSTPQGCAVGMTEEEAAEQLDNAAIYTNCVTPLVAAVTGSMRPVFLKMIVDMDTDVIKGLHMMGDTVIEIVQGFAVCVKVGITKTQLDSTIGIHPTLAEEVVTLSKPCRVVGRKADKKAHEAVCVDG